MVYFLKILCWRAAGVSLQICFDHCRTRGLTPTARLNNPRETLDARAWERETSLILRAPLRVAAKQDSDSIFVLRHSFDIRHWEFVMFVVLTTSRQVRKASGFLCREERLSGCLEPVRLRQWFPIPNRIHLWMTLAEMRAEGTNGPA